MANPNKQAGTRLESGIVRMAQDAGLLSDRYPEGGINDQGDVWIEVNDLTFAIECKATQTGSIHAWMNRQRGKARAHAIPAVVWKRVIKASPDAKRRTSQGTIVSLDMKDFLYLLTLIGENDGTPGA